MFAAELGATSRALALLLDYAPHALADVTLKQMMEGTGYPS